VIADMLADAQEFLGGDVDELTALLDEFASYGEQPVPAPSPELALLLAGRPAAPASRPERPAVPVRVRARRAVAGLAAAAVSGLSVTGAAAVANELPAPMQRAVAHFSEQYLPFSFPRPAGDPPVPGGSVGTAPGQDGAGTDPAPGRAETGTTRTGQGAPGGESRGRTAPVTGPSRTSGPPTGKSGKTGAPGPAVGGGHATTTHTVHPEAVHGGADLVESKPEPGSDDKPTTPPKGHAHAGSGNSGKGATATPERPARTPKSAGSAPKGRATGAGSTADGTVSDASRAPRSGHDTKDASGASSGALPAKSDAPKVRADEANAEHGSGADSS
jgi:hypothetical protein